jgi:inner membrane protein
MASAFSHAIAALAIAKVSRAAKWPGDLPKVDYRFWLIAVFCAVSPDLDAIGFWMGVPYDSMWGHRGDYTFPVFCGFAIAGIGAFFLQAAKGVYPALAYSFYCFFCVRCLTRCARCNGVWRQGRKGSGIFCPLL